MSVHVTSLIWKNGPANSMQRLVLLCMADYANDDGAAIFPSLTTIAKRCALTRRAVINIVNALEAAGYVDRERRWNGGRHRSNLYTIRVNRLADGEPRSPLVVNDVHYDGEPRSPLVVNDVHYDGEPRSPDPPLIHHKQPPKRSTTPPPPGRSKNGVAGGGGGGTEHPLYEVFQKYGYGWDETVQAVAACAWVTPEYVAAHTAAANRDAARDRNIKYPLRVALSRMLKGAAADLGGGQAEVSGDPEIASAWRRVANAVAQYGASDDALDAIAGWGDGDGETLAEIADSFGLDRISHSQGRAGGERVRSEFVAHYRQAIVARGTAT